MSEPVTIDGFRARQIALNDQPSVIAGVTTAIFVHIAVISTALWPGLCPFRLSLRSVLRPPAQCLAPPRPVELPHPPDEEIIEGALLRQGGGGEYDPRRMIHRQPPIRAEQRAESANGLAHSREHPPDGGTTHDPNAVVTTRDVMGRGNQDLAELQRLAEAESMNAIPTAPPGPGSPDGSVNGTETDPNRAGHGAQAKIRSFLQRQLHLLATAPAAAHRTFRLRIIIASDGNSIARGQIVDGSGDETTDSDLALQLAQLAENQTAIPELTDEEKAAIAGHSYSVRYLPE